VQCGPLELAAAVDGLLLQAVSEPPGSNVTVGANSTWNGASWQTAAYPWDPFNYQAFADHIIDILMHPLQVYLRIRVALTAAGQPPPLP
jgi:hypothetical protein